VCIGERVYMRKSRKLSASLRKIRTKRIRRLKIRLAIIEASIAQDFITMSNIRTEILRLEGKED
jgi:hypothetical protein